MELSSEEEKRKGAIERHSNGEKPIDIYTNLGRSRYWFYKWLKRYKTGRKKWFKDSLKQPKKIHNKTDDQIEQAVVDLRKRLMEGSEEPLKYSCVGADAIQYHMEKSGYKSTEIPSISTIKRIIKRHKLKVNKRERYKRIKSKGRYTVIKPTLIDEMHQMDFVGPRYIKGYGPINSLHLRDVVGRQTYGQQYVGKSTDNVMDFLLKHWKKHPIPKYLQVDNGMSFAGDFIHPRSFSRFVRLALYVGIEVIFIAPSKPWMNGCVEGFNGEFNERFWTEEQFKNLKDIRKKSKILYNIENKLNAWKLKGKNLERIKPIRKLIDDFSIDGDNIPLVTGKVHFIRIVDLEGKIHVLNESFSIGKAYIGEYVWATIDTRKQLITILYNDENLIVQEIKTLQYEIDEAVGYRKHSIYKTRGS